MNSAGESPCSTIEDRRAHGLHFVLRRIPVFTRCIWRGIGHCIDMDEQSPRKLSMRVFIVDDSKVVVERLADLLKEVPGVQFVGQAHDVAQAVDGIQKMKPDAIILDLQIPGGSGLDILRAIRADYPHPHVLICTNHPYPQYREECLTVGAHFFLDKSAEFQKVPAILRELIEKEIKAPPYVD